MKKVLLFLGVTLALTTVASCRKEGCTDPDSINYNADAKKDDGSCQYAPIAPINQKFYGIYNMLPGCGDSHIMSITLIGESGIILNNFADNNQGWGLIANVLGDNFSIPFQTFSDGEGDYNVSGSGNLIGNTITLQLSIEYIDYFEPEDDFSINCTTTGTK
jgi:hypothetical protein